MSEYGMGIILDVAVPQNVDAKDPMWKLSQTGDNPYSMDVVSLTLIPLKQG